MTARVFNRQRLNAKLRALPKAAEDEIRKAIAKSADEITEMARGLAPVDDGDLRRSIGWTWGEAPKGSKVLGKASAGANLTATVFAGDDKAYYARWVEFGTTKMSAQAYFFPSYRSNKKRAKNRIARATSKAAKSVA